MSNTWVGNQDLFAKEDLERSAFWLSRALVQHIARVRTNLSRPNCPYMVTTALGDHGARCRSRFARTTKVTWQVWLLGEIALQERACRPEQLPYLPTFSMVESFFATLHQVNTASRAGSSILNPPQRSALSFPVRPFTSQLFSNISIKPYFNQDLTVSSSKDIYRKAIETARSCRRNYLALNWTVKYQKSAKWTRFLIKFNSLPERASDGPCITCSYTREIRIPLSPPKI